MTEEICICGHPRSEHTPERGCVRLSLTGTEKKLPRFDGWSRNDFIRLIAKLEADLATEHRAGWNDAIQEAARVAEQATDDEWDDGQVHRRIRALAAKDGKP